MPALPDKPELACMNLIESLLHALKDHGARQIFGIPGDFALPYFRIIEESKILPLYTLSHEPGVGFAADASARINGSLGVAAVTYGAGALNMINSIAAAFAEKSPLVVLSGGPGKGESRSGLLLHHQAKTLDSQFQIFKEITCDQVRLDDAARAPADIARVLASCLRRSEPVYIEIPRDMVNEPCAPVVPEAPQPVDPDALAACVDEILARLASARSPVLMAGVEVRRYGLEAQVAQLARRLGVPVVTGFMGRGLLADQEVPLLGTYMGVAGFPEVTATRGGLGRAVPAGRDHLRHQLRRLRRPRSTCARRSRRWMAASPSATTPIRSCRWPPSSNACWRASARVTSRWP
jgi:indolepyruvate decarboxylase